jgi:hypothetical protein
MSGVLFISLCRSTSFIDGLFKAVSSEDDSCSLEQRQACANVLRELLLKSGEKVFEQTDFSKPIPNMLSAIHDKLHEHAIVHLEKLCTVITNMENQKSVASSIPFSSYAVKRPFGMFRFTLVEILADLIVNAPKSLDKVPAALWRVLSTWFLDYAHNNLYHGQFWKIVQVAVRDNHVESLKTLFAKNKFLSKIIDHYKTEATAAKGFIILITNSLRLASDAQAPSEWLRHYLLSHDPWKLFQQTLRQDTETQLKRYSEEGYEEEIEEVEMDLGSPYARSLGFDKEPIIGLGESPNSRKKRRKKHNKKKKVVQPTEQTSASPSEDEEEEGEEDNGKEDEEGTREHSNREKPKGEEEDEKPAETPSWWLDMKDEFTKESDAKNESSPQSDWWKDLTEELQKVP